MQCNSILTLQQGDNTWIMGRDNIGACFSYYFDELFCSSNPAIPFEFSNLITSLITSAEAAVLDSIPTEVEIFNSVRSLGSTKALGPEGLPALFYTTYWDTVSSEEIRRV